MSEMDRLRRQFRQGDDLTGPEGEIAGEDTEFEDWIRQMADDILPSDITIDLLIRDVAPFEPSPDWQTKAAARWAIVVGEFDRHTPPLGDLLRDARMRTGARPEELAALLGWEPVTYHRLEEGRSPGALVNATQGGVRALASRLTISRALLVAATAGAMGSAADSLFGHRPRAGDVGPVVRATDPNRERLNEWARGVLVES